MSKQLIYSTLVFLITSLAFVLFRSNEGTRKLVYIEYLQEAKILPKKDAKYWVEQLNQKNAKIKSVFSDNVRIKIQNVPFKLRASLCYEKKQNFRMIVKSIVGKELDVGSNSKLFWFWSRRMNPPTLNYAEYKDLYKTYLKTPLHPLWLMESLGVNKMNINSSIGQSGKYIIISENRISASNTSVIKKTIIDTQIMAVVGHYLFEGGKLTASAEVKSFSNNIPKEMTIIWIDENITMYLNLQDVKINYIINPNYWNMPSMKNKTNLADSF